MNANLNRGEWKQMENKWANALRKGKKVKVDIEPLYESTDMRPNGFRVLYTIDDNDIVLKEFLNQASK